MESWEEAWGPGSIKRLYREFESLARLNEAAREYKDSYVPMLGLPDVFTSVNSVERYKALKDMQD